MAITHLHAPQHMFAALEANLDTIARLRPTTAVLTEQDAGKHDSVARVRKRLGRKYHVLAAKADPSHSREIIVLLRRQRGRRVENVKVDRLSRDFGPGVGNDRVMVVVRWHDWRGLAATIGTHWNAAIQNKETGALLDISRAQVMTEAGKALEEVLNELEEEGRRVTGSADFNYRDGLPKSHEWRYAPSNIFRRTDTRAIIRGLDYLWWTPKTLTKRKERIIEAGTGGNHSDHPWIIATFRRPRLKRTKRSKRGES